MSDLGMEARPYAPLPPPDPLVHLTRAPLGGGRFCPPPLSNIRDNLRTT